MLEISILGASICIGRKITYFIRASENGEINKGNSSIIGDEGIKKLKGSAASFLLPQKLREDDGASIQYESQKTYDGAMQNIYFGMERRQICRWRQNV